MYCQCQNLKIKVPAQKKPHLQKKWLKKIRFRLSPQCSAMNFLILHIQGEFLLKQNQVTLSHLGTQLVLSFGTQFWYSILVPSTYCCISGCNDPFFDDSLHAVLVYGLLRVTILFVNSIGFVYTGNTSPGTGPTAKKVRLVSRFYSNSLDSEQTSNLNLQG